MEIHLPPTIEDYEPELRLIFDLMVTKLNMSRHKGFVEGCTFESLMGGLHSEINEMAKARKDESQMSTIMEAVDVANMAALIAVMFLRQTKTEFNNGRQ